MEPLEQFYRRYLAKCNAHEFDALDEFVHEDVRLNGESCGLSAYVSGLLQIVEAFPDYTWHLEHLIVDPPILAAHVVDTGTQRARYLDIDPTGRRVSVQEFAFYRVSGNRICDCWDSPFGLSLREELLRSV